MRAVPRPGRVRARREQRAARRLRIGVGRAQRGSAAGVSTRIGIVGHAQRGQVLAVQRAHESRRGGGQLPVHDDRAQRRGRAGARRAPGARCASTVGASEIVWDTIDFHDIAGLVAGAHEGEGLGNRFLANIRETDAIVHVVRAHGDESVVHPEGRVDPLAGHRDDRDRARARRPRAGRAPRRARRQAGAQRRPRGGRRGGVAARGDRGAAGRAPGARRARARGGARTPRATSAR